jgi:hypothetical protein
MKSNGATKMQSARNYLNKNELWLYIGFFCIAATIHWCLLGFTINTEDCRGAGARYPGGCPEFTQARGILIFTSLLVCTILFVLIMLLLSKKAIHKQARLLITALYNVVVIVLPFPLAYLSIFLPPKL